MFFTGYSRNADSILEEQRAGSNSGESDVVESLHVIKAIGDSSRDALQVGDTGTFAALMNEHWEHKKRRSSTMSNPCHRPLVPGGDGQRRPRRQAGWCWVRWIPAVLHQGHGSTTRGNECRGSERGAVSIRPRRLCRSRPRLICNASFWQAGSVAECCPTLKACRNPFFSVAGRPFVDWQLAMAGSRRCGPRHHEHWLSRRPDPAPSRRRQSVWATSQLCRRRGCAVGDGRGIATGSRSRASPTRTSSCSMVIRTSRFI